MSAIFLIFKPWVQLYLLMCVCIVLPTLVAFRILILTGYWKLSVFFLSTSLGTFELVTYYLQELKQQN